MKKFDKLLTEADELIGKAMRLAKCPLAVESLKEAQFQILDACAYEEKIKVRNKRY